MEVKRIKLLLSAPGEREREREKKKVFQSPERPGSFRYKYRFGDCVVICENCWLVAKICVFSPTTAIVSVFVAANQMSRIVVTACLLGSIDCGPTVCFLAGWKNFSSRMEIPVTLRSCHFWKAERRGSFYWHLRMFFFNRYFTVGYKKKGLRMASRHPP